MELSIDKDAVTELAAQKMADAILSEHYDDIHETASRKVEKAVNDAIANSLDASLREQLDATMKANLEGLMEREIVPVDIWGEATGKPTTIRGHLHDRALKFWEARVDKDGRETSYGGEARYKQVYREVTKEAFEAAIKENVTAIVTAFNEALRNDATALVNAHINRLIALPKR